MSEPLKADLLQGAIEIGQFLNMRPRRVQYLIETAGLPTFKVGGRICATRSELNKWIKAKSGKGDEANG